MKQLIFTLVGAATGVVLTLVVVRGGKAPATIGATAVGSGQGTDATAAAAGRRSGGARGMDSIVWALLPGETPVGFQRRLSAAGVPPEIIADILRGFADRELKNRLTALKLTGVETNWTPYRELVSRKKQADAMLAEKTKADEAHGMVPKKFEFLSSEKYLASKAIEDQARQRREQLMGAGLDPAARDVKLREARLEKVAQLRALMDDREYVQYAMKTEPLVAAYASAVNFFEPSEAEFMKLTAIYEKHLEAFSLTPEALAKGALRIEEQAVFREEVRALLGDERYKAYQEATDPTVRGALRVAADAGLSLAHGKWLMQTDRAYSQAIGNVPAAEPERRAALIVQFEEALQKELGAAALAQYRDSMGGWLRMQKNRAYMEARAQGKQLPPGFTPR